MTSFRVAIFALILLFPLTAQAELTLVLGTPGDHPFTDPMDQIEITASAIDAALGTNVFSTQSDALTVKLGQMRQDLETDLIDLAEDNPRIIDIIALTVATDPISVRLTQETGAIGLNVTGIHLNSTVKADVPFPENLLCSTITITVEANFIANGSFNYLTGLLENIEFIDDLNVTDANCSGIISFLANFANDLFGVVNHIVENKLESEAQIGLDFDDIETIFSLDDLTQDLAQALGSGPVQDKVLELVDHIVNRVSVNRGLQLDIIFDPNFYGVNSPSLSLIASQQAPWIESHNIASGTLMYVTAPGADQYDIYSGYVFLTTTSQENFLYQPRQGTGLDIEAVARSSLIPGLRSFPSKTYTDDIVECNPLQGC